MKELRPTAGQDLSPHEGKDSCKDIFQLVLKEATPVSSEERQVFEDEHANHSASGPGESAGKDLRIRMSEIGDHIKFDPVTLPDFGHGSLYSSSVRCLDVDWIVGLKDDRKHGLHVYHQPAFPTPGLNKGMLASGRHNLMTSLSIASRASVDRNVGAEEGELQILVFQIRRKAYIV